MTVACECLCCHEQDEAASAWHFSRRGWRNVRSSDAVAGLAFGWCPPCWRTIRVCQADMQARGEYLDADGRIRRRA